MKVPILPANESVMAKLNSRVLYGFFIMAGFFKSTTQNMRLNTKAEPAIILNATSRTVCDWMASVYEFDWLVGVTG